MIRRCYRAVRAMTLAIATLLSAPSGAVAEVPPVPDPADLIALVQKTIVAVAEGNAEGDFTALHAMGSPAFQRENTPAALADRLAALRATWFAPSAIEGRMPLTTRSPTLDRNGRLRILGYYDLLDRQLVYDFVYDYDQAVQRWLLAGLAVTPRVLPPQPQLLQPE